MRSVPVLIAVIIGAAAVIAGCGQQHPGNGAAAPAPSASPSHPMVACANASPAAQPSKLTITAADNGRSFCVTRGTSVAVFLKRHTDPQVGADPGQLRRAAAARQRRAHAGDRR